MAGGEHKSAARRARILDGPIGPTLARLAVPTVAGALIQITISVVEGAAIGRLGIDALAGSALVFPLYMLTAMLSAGAIGGAVSGAMARASGSGDARVCADVARAAMVIALIGAGVMGGLLTVAGPAFFRLLGGSGAALEAAVAYGAVFFPGMLAVWLFNMTAGLLRGTGEMVVPMAGIAAVTAIHATIAWPLIGWGGMGGAALAVLTAYGLGAAGLLAYVFTGRAGFRLTFRVAVPWGLVRRCLASGMLAGTQSVLTVSTSLLVAAVAGRIGIEALAGYAIAARLELLMTPLIFGVGAALIAMVGGNAGAGRRARAVRIGWTGALIAAALVGTIGFVVAAAPGLWVPLFTREAAVVAVAQQGLGIVGPAYGFFGLGLALYFASQGLGTLFWPVSGSVVRLSVIVAVLAAAHAMDALTTGVLFAAVAAGMASYGLFNAAALRAGPWRGGG